MALTPFFVSKFILNQINMDTKLYHPEDVRFLKEANLHGSPRPLRRILSLFRTYSTAHNNTATLLKEVTYRENAVACDNKCKRRKISCDNFFGKVTEDGAHLNKKCIKYYFFDKRYSDTRRLKASLEKSKVRLIGYCMVHIDNLTKTTETHKEISETNAYVAEAIISDCLKDGNQVLLNQIHQELNIGSIKTKTKIVGYYFCQQNAQTNCCAEAAIKMAIKGFCSNITAASLTKIFSERKEEDKLKNIQSAIRQAGGIKLKDIQSAIQYVSGGKLDSYPISSLTTSPLEFITTIYMAIESRFPVLLSFDRSGMDGLRKDAGHIVALMGHTFAPSSWGFYGGLYFSSCEKEYVVSSCFSDSFIVHDDNIGPLYNIAQHTIASYIDHFANQTRFINELNIRMNGYQQHEMNAMIVHPVSVTFLKSMPSLVSAAKKILHDLVLFNSKYMPKLDEDFKTYFYDFYTYETPQSLPKTAESIILRPILITKREYFASYVKQIFAQNRVDPSNASKLSLYSFLNYSLPEHIWVIEISVPELYWINKKKVGELIIDPIAFDHYCSPAVNGGDYSRDRLLSSFLLLRLPKFMLMNNALLNKYNGEEPSQHHKFTYYSLDQADVYCELTKDIKGFQHVI